MAMTTNEKIAKIEKLYGELGVRTESLKVKLKSNQLRLKTYEKKLKALEKELALQNPKVVNIKKGRPKKRMAVASQ